MNSRRLFESLLKIRNFDEFKPFREKLAQEVDRHMNVLIGTNDEVQLRQAQGAIRALRHVIELIEGSQDALDKGRSEQGREFS